ncbi:alpha/beta hydrolase, partial [Streptomyces sp. SID5785]|uniref:alpha/beta fold hydrolase n=1 Tax=Streptomyces sp. SID5785 TaxID=2690309 RepID=UPI001361170F
IAALADRAGPPGGGDRPAALVLAGLPGAGQAEFSTWEAELDARTTCPVHRGTLTEDPEVAHGSFAAPVPDDLLDAARAGTSALPHLILAGDRDPLTDQDATALLADKLPRARFGVVHGAHHDVLDDQQHRTVAAEIVTFLESLRAGLAPLLTVETSAW